MSQFYKGSFYRSHKKKQINIVIVTLDECIGTSLIHLILLIRLQIYPNIKNIFSSCLNEMLVET